MREIRTILVPTDFSDVSVVALHHARALARRFGARIIVTHVLKDTLSLVPDDSSGSKGLERSVDLLRTWTHESLDRLVAEHLGDVPDVERQVAVGVPHVEIVGLTEACNADLIIMATHGARFGSRPRPGLTTDQVSRRTQCPVLVVRDRRTSRRRTAS